MVGWQDHGCGIVLGNGSFRGPAKHGSRRKDAALVGFHQVEYGEEGLACGPVLIVRLGTALIPDLTWINAAGIVIRLHIVGAVIPFLHEQRGIGLDQLRSPVSTSHLLIPVGCRIDPGNDGIPGRRAHRAVGIGTGIAESFQGQLVQVGSGSVLISVTTQERAVILTGYPQDVGQLLFRLTGYRPEHAHEQKNQDHEGKGRFRKVHRRYKFIGLN